MFLAVLILTMLLSGEELLATPPRQPTELTEQGVEPEPYPLLMEVKELTPVRRGMSVKHAVTSRINPGAILRVRLRGRSPSCPQGWMERMEGGYICATHLVHTDEREARLAKSDVPNLLDGLQAMQVTRGGLDFYRKKKRVEKRLPSIHLHEGSILVVRGEVEIKGKSYYQTRAGWFAEAKNIETLPSPIMSLGVPIEENNKDLPGGIVVGENTRVSPSCSTLSTAERQLERWSVIPRAGNERLISMDGCVQLPNGDFMRDEDIARLRSSPQPKKLKENERWIAIDLGEQLLQAYEGERLVRIIPCSTGKRGNTRPGQYRVQWKRRRQTMKMRQGHVRVEDVQWVMYYDRAESIAIHSAYWHRDFGQPVSHGCVNLPRDDAKWLFEWSEPRVSSVDSERFPIPGEPGTQIIVFK